MSRLEKGWGDILHNPLAYIGHVPARLPLQALDTSGVNLGQEDLVERAVIFQVRKYTRTDICLQ